MTLDQSSTWNPSPEDLQAIAAVTEKIKGLLRRTNEDVVEIGRQLNAIRPLIPERKWQQWLKDEFGMSQPTAYRFMRIAKERGDDIAFRGNAIERMDRHALFFLSSPDVSEDVRAEAVNRAAGGEHITEAEARNLVHIERAAKKRFSGKGKAEDKAEGEGKIEAEAETKDKAKAKAKGHSKAKTVVAKSNSVKPPPSSSKLKGQGSRSQSNGSLPLRPLPFKQFQEQLCSEATRLLATINEPPADLMDHLRNLVAQISSLVERGYTGGYTG
jgi:hypothetical protein